jgi:hypothetical protein
MPDFNKQYDVTIHDLYLEDNQGENRYNKRDLFMKTNDSMPMDRLQVRSFVVQQALTPYKQIQQCMMEIDGRKAGLKEHEFVMRELDADMAIYKEKIEKAPEGPQREKYQVKLERVQYNYERKKLSRKRMEVEIGYLLEMYQELTNVLSFEEMDSRRDELELEYWETRMSKQAGVDLLSHGVIGVGNMLSIMDMPKETMERTLALTVNVAEKMKNELPDGVGKKLFSLGQTEMKRELELELSKEDFLKLAQEKNDTFLDTPIINSEKEKVPEGAKDTEKE